MMCALEQRLGNSTGQRVRKFSDLRGDADCGSNGACASERLARRLFVRPIKLREQIVEIQRVGVHLQRAVGLFRPFVFRAIPIELDSIVVGITQIERFAHAMVAGALKRNLRHDEPAQSVGEQLTGRVKNGRMVKARGAGRGR